MAWELYKEIKYTADGVPPGTLSGFPKLVSVSGDADIASECSAGGGIKFTTPDGLTDLSFGLYPSVDLSSGDVLARVKLDLSHTASVGDVMCRLYYSATETTTEDKAGTVSNSYAVFCPLEEDPSGSAPQVFDWVSEANIGTANGSMTTGDLVTGQVGGSLDFDGSNDYVSLGAHGVGEDKTATYEVIVKTTQTGRDRWLIGEGSTSGSRQVSGFCNESGNLRGFLRDADSANLVGTTTINDGLFHGLSMTLDSTVMRLYVDGVEDGSTSIASVSIESGVLNRLTIGALGRNTTSLYSQATIDEVRVSSVARSDDWLAYAHIDDFDNSSTFTLGEEQGGGGGGTTVDESLSLGLAGGVSSAANVTVGEALTLAAGAGVSSGGPASASAAFSLAAGAGLTSAGDASASAGVSFPLAASITHAADVTADGAVSLSLASAALVAAGVSVDESIAAVLRAAIQVSGTATADASLSAALASAAGFATGNAISETLAAGLAAGLAAQENVSAQASLVASVLAAVQAAGSVQASDLLTLAVEGLLSVSSGHTLDENLSLGVAATLSASAQATVADQITAALRSAIQTQAFAVAADILPLNVSGDLRAAATASIEAAITISVQSQLVTAAPHQHGIIRLVAERLSAPRIGRQSLAIPSVTGDRLET